MGALLEMNISKGLILTPDKYNYRITFALEESFNASNKMCANNKFVISILSPLNRRGKK